MKLVQHFNDLLKDTVNLNQDRIDTLDDHVGAIKDFLENSDYEAPIRSFSPQGSWAHETIIRPPKDKEFDADLVMYVDPVEGWEARDYILDLCRVFLNSDRYKKITILKTRCVRINYAGDFHLDIVPIVVRRRNKVVTYSVCNHTDNAFEDSDGDGYAAWWSEQNGFTNGHLKRVVRLLKYLRDSKKTFSIKSVLFTTLVGERISDIDELIPNKFADVPTALKTVVGRLDDWLQDPDHEKMPDVTNPALRQESFTRHWTQAQYDTFRDKIHDYREWIDDAYAEQDQDESIRKWRRVFKDFAKGDADDRATTALTKFAESLEPGRDLVAVVLSWGAPVLAMMPTSFLHVQPLRYGRSNTQIAVHITAKERSTEDGPLGRSLQSGHPIDAHSGIQFHAIGNTGMPFLKDYKIFWQVVNTDRAAVRENALRGEFYRSDPPSTRYEATKYRGVHWVQAFVINKRNGLCDGASERFFVVVR